MDLSYPIGPCEYPSSVPVETRGQHIADIEAAPARFREAVADLNNTQLDTPYRPGGWTVRQVVHHFADSHLNAYTRFRLALTEPEPTIKPYDEKKWAELRDARSMRVEPSLQLVESLHCRWVTLLRSMTDADFARTLNHPELGVLRLDTYLASYSWHCRHHAAHINNLRRRMGWK
jgi:DinB family protein